MKSHFSCLLFCVILCHSASCQTTCDLTGSWILKGSLTPNFQRTSHNYSRNRVTFSKGQVELASGFFYSILSMDEGDWARGRYPFVFYGDKEAYKIAGNSLQIYSRPTETWESFKVECLSTDSVRLTTQYDTIFLRRREPDSYTGKCSIKRVRASVFEVGSGLYANNYRVTYSPTDSVLFEQLSDRGADRGHQMLRFSKGTFSKICTKLGMIDLSKLKDVYSSPHSEVEVKEIEIEMIDGKKYNLRLENDDYPEELRFATLEILYGHQQYIYGHLPVVDDRKMSAKD